MITAIRGYYEEGKVILFEKPPLNSLKRKPRGLKGKVTLPEDFDEPLDDLEEYI